MTATAGRPCNLINREGTSTESLSGQCCQPISFTGQKQKNYVDVIFVFFKDETYLWPHIG